MRTKTTVMFALLCGLFWSCAASRTPQPGSGPEAMRQLFVGIWEGEYLDGEGNLVRSWTQHRLADGTYTITFVHYTGAGVRKIKRKGTWWIEESRFFERTENSDKKPDVYDFKVVSQDEIRFQSTETDYAFTDRRVSSPKKTSFI